MCPAPARDLGWQREPASAPRPTATLERDRGWGQKHTNLNPLGWQFYSCCFQEGIPEPDQSTPSQASPSATGLPAAAYGSSMSRNSCLGGAAPRYHAQEPSLLLMQAKNLAWCPLMFFSVTQSIQRHSSGEEM